MECPISPIFLFLIGRNLNAQEVKRIAISGKCDAVNDVEGATIYNSSSKRGTLANSQGSFTLEVAIKDVLEISAVQYEINISIVYQDDIDSKQTRLFLADKVKALNKVLLLPSQFSGNLLVNKKNAKEKKVLQMNFGDLSQVEFPEDELTKVDNKLLKQSQLTNGLNVASFLGRNKLINKPEQKHFIPIEEVNLKTLLERKYSQIFYQKNDNISSHRVEDFISFVVSNGFNKSYLEAGKELYVLNLCIILVLNF